MSECGGKGGRWGKELRGCPPLHGRDAPPRWQKGVEPPVERVERDAPAQHLRVGVVALLLRPRATCRCVTVCRRKQSAQRGHSFASAAGFSLSMHRQAVRRRYGRPQSWPLAAAGQESMIKDPYR